MKRFLLIGCGLAAFAALTPVSARAQSQTAGFSYQGQLQVGNTGYDGTYDTEFRLYDAPQNGNLLGSQLIPGVNFVDGLFNVTLNPAGEFGASAFNGQQRWLEIRVNNVLLNPRQPITTAPYSAFSLNTRGISVGAGGRIGIGAATPAAALHVQTSQDTALRLQTSSNRWFDLQVAGSDGALRFLEGGDSLLTLQPSGFAGIGSGSQPDRPLSIAASGAGNDLMSFQTTSGSTRWYFSMNGGGFNLGESTGTNSTRLYVKNGGFVGIGTTNPTANLEVVGTTKTSILHITGGSDIAEPFNVNTDDRQRTGAAHDAIRPGMVVAIDPDRVGELRIAERAYDTAVAGIISGANGVNVGLTLTQDGTAASGQHPVAMTGRVWCYVDADANGAIRAGDLLTTSTTPGHAMKASDRQRSGGAILGKAMSALDSGQGLVLVLVNLQ